MDLHAHGDASQTVLRVIDDEVEGEVLDEEKQSYQGAKNITSGIKTAFFWTELPGGK